MPVQSTDHNLLFGFLALQNNFIAREELIAAVSVWLTDKSRSLDDILRERRALADDEREVIAALVDKHLARHSGDAKKCITAVSTMSLRDDLRGLADTDPEVTLSLEPAASGTSEGQAADSRPNEALTSAKSRFRVLRHHAKGGLGDVFVARDLELNREVALKEIQRHRADHPASRARFVLEAEVTGGLEHPGIVPVYGLGQYPDGRPYYAMRFVRGDSFKEAIARFHSVGRTPSPPNSPVERASSLPDLVELPSNLPNRVEQASSLPDLLELPFSLPNPSDSHFTPSATAGSSSRALRSGARSAPSFDSVEFRKLLGRFIAVCNAIEYAHSRGVLHRDLKPGNIMLGKYGETLVVDWGLAKVQGRDEQHQDSDEQTLQPGSGSSAVVTQMNQAIGTPAFMSPEQAAGRLDQLGPASDVYSLGATLYSLLAGGLPFASRPGDDILDRVKTGDFPRPRQVCPSIPQPLEAICLKAMALKPSDRYPSPQALSDELERYLADEPIRAHLEPLTVRTRRWLRKRPRSVAAIAATLLVGVTSSLLIASVIADRNRQLTAANASERRAKSDAESKRNEAEKEKQIAQAVKDFLQNSLLSQAGAWAQADALLRDTGSSGDVKENPTIRELLDRAAAELAPHKIELQFPNMPNVQAEVLRTIGQTYRSIGEYQRASDHLERSRDIRIANFGPNTVETLMTLDDLALAYYSAGRTSEAISLFENVRDKQIERLGPDHPHTLRTLHDLAAAYNSHGRTTEALALYEQLRTKWLEKLAPDHPDVLASLHNLALVYRSAGRAAEAIALYEQVRDKQIDKLGPDHPDTLTTLHNLALAYWSENRESEAISLLERVRDKRIAKLGLDHPDTLSTSSSLAVAYRRTMNTTVAIAMLEEVRDKQIQKLGLNHPATIATFTYLAAAYAGGGRLPEAITLLEHVRDKKYERLGRDHPETLTAVYELATAYFQDNRFAKAIPLLEEVLTRWAPKFGPDHPEILSISSNLAVATCSYHGDAAYGRHEYDEAIAHYGLALLLNPKQASAHNSIAWLRATCFDVQYRDGQQAIEHATKACELTDWKDALYLSTLAAAYAETNDFAKAIEFQQRAIAIGVAGRDNELHANLELYKSGKPHRQPSPSLHEATAAPAN